MVKWFRRVKMKSHFCYSIIDYREQPRASKGIVHRNSHIVQRETIWFTAYYWQYFHSQWIYSIVYMHISHWEMITGRYWMFTILNDSIHRFTSRPNSHIDEFQYNSIKRSRIERKHSSKQTTNWWIMERQIAWSFKHHPKMPWKKISFVHTLIDFTIFVNSMTILFPIHNRNDNKTTNPWEIVNEKEIPTIQTQSQEVHCNVFLSSTIL